MAKKLIQAGRAKKPLVLPATPSVLESTTVMMTPVEAAKLLESNTHNRPMRDSVIDRYARDMKEGRWIETHESIAIASDGEIVDGQHRLWAVLFSGATVPLRVTYNASKESQKVIDSGVIRTVVDVVALHDGSVKPKEAAISNRMLLGTRTGVAPSRAESIVFMEKHMDAIRFVMEEVFPKMKRSITTAPVMAVVARAYYKEDRDRLREFGEVMFGGVVKTQADTSAILLRNFLLESTFGAGANAAILTYRKTERALRAFLDRTKLAKLYEATEELFPLAKEVPLSDKRQTFRNFRKQVMENKAAPK